MCARMKLWRPYHLGRRWPTGDLACQRFYEPEYHDKNGNPSTGADQSKPRRSRPTGLRALGGSGPAGWPGRGVLAASRGGTSCVPAERPFARNGCLAGKRKAQSRADDGLRLSMTQCAFCWAGTRALSSVGVSIWRGFFQEFTG